MRLDDYLFITDHEAINTIKADDKTLYDKSLMFAEQTLADLCDNKTIDTRNYRVDRAKLSDKGLDITAINIKNTSFDVNMSGIWKQNGTDCEGCKNCGKPNDYCYDLRCVRALSYAGISDGYEVSE